MKRFLFFFYLSLISFFSYADIVRIVGTAGYTGVDDACGFHNLTLHAESNFSCLIGKGSDPISSYRIYWNSTRTAGSVYITNAKLDDVLAYNFHFYACESGYSQSPITGYCEVAEPVCQDGEELNADSGECESVPFCESQSVLDEYAAQYVSCTDSGGVFQYSCNELFQTADFQCLDGSACNIGAVNWPSCLGDIDPTTPIDKPSDSFDSGTADSIDPTAPWQKDEPDEVTTDDTTDTAVLTAIQNMNRDQNQALGQISSDMNQGFADTNTRLNQLNSTASAIGQSIVDQMNQDYALAQSQRQTQLQTTNAITNGTAAITGAIENQTDSLLGGLSSNGDKLDAINGSLGDIADLLGTDTDCEPTADNNYCEPTHGLNAVEAQNLYGDISSSTLDEETKALSNISNYIDTKIENSPTTSTDMENNASGVFDLVPALLGSSSGCSDLSFPTMQGDTAVISCEFSTKAKAVISLAFYVYTIYTIGGLIVGGITPTPTRKA